MAMNPIRRAMLRLRAVVGRGALERDMRAEMQEHLDRATERYLARGMSLQDARAAARREFGNVAVLQEEARDIRRTRWVGDAAADARFAFRYFARHRATTTIIVMVLALGTGANTLIFSVFQAQFLRPAPAVPDDAALSRIWSEERRAQTAELTPRRFTGSELDALAAQREVFQDVAAWTEDDVVLIGDSSGARSVRAQFVTPNYFTTLGVRLSAGLGLRQDAQPGQDASAVVSHAIAERFWGSAAAAVGQRATVNNVAVHIVGVAPPRFQGALRNMDEPALWMPVSVRADIARVPRAWLADSASLSLLARLAPGISRDRAAVFARQVVATFLPDSAGRAGLTRTATVIGLQEPPPGKDSAELVLAFNSVLGVSILILLVACTNVSSLMVAAAVGRKHEIAVRLSLGASRSRLLRQLVTESTLLALAGSAVGLTSAWWFLTYIARRETGGVNVAPDPGTFTFVLAMAVATGVLFGLSPAFHAIRHGVADALRGTGAGAGNRSRLQRGFVVAQIALSQPLLVVLATLLALIVGDYHPLSPEVGRQVIAVNVRPLSNGMPGQGPGAVDSLVPRIAEHAAVRDAVPDAAGFGIRSVFAVDGAGAARVQKIVTMEGAAPGWFDVMDLPVMLGRDVALADTLEALPEQPVVIGSDLAQALWGGASPIGRRLVSPALPGWDQDSIAMVVVGMYDAAHRTPGTTWGGGIARGDEPTRVYTARGRQWRHDRILVRTRGLAAPRVPDIQQLVRTQAPSLPVISTLTLAEEDRRAYVAMLRMVALAVAGGALALLLASLGLYGIISLAVRQRTREIGIRLAVGAHPSQLVRMFLVSGVRVSLVALALGLPISIAALKVGLSQGLVIAPGVNPWLLGVGIATILLAVASAATWIPARRATLVEPTSTLRTD